MTSPRDGGSSDELERLRGDRSRTRQPGRPRRLAQDLGDAERRVLGRAAAGHDDRLRRPRTVVGDRRRPAPPPARRRRPGAAEDPRARAPARPRSSRSCGTAGRIAGSACRSRPTGRAGRGGERSDRSASVVVIEARIGAARRPGRATRVARRPSGSDVAPNASPWGPPHDVGTDGAAGGTDAGRADGAPGLEGRVRRLGPAADAWARTRRARRAGRGARLRVALGLRPLPHRPATRPTRSPSSRSRS